MIGGHGLGRCNDRERMLVIFCTKNKLRIINTSHEILKEENTRFEKRNGTVSTTLFAQCPLACHLFTIQHNFLAPFCGNISNSSHSVLSFQAFLLHSVDQ